MSKAFKRQFCKGKVALFVLVLQDIFEKFPQDALPARTEESAD